MFEDFAVFEVSLFSSTASVVETPENGANIICVHLIKSPFTLELLNRAGNEARDCHFWLHSCLNNSR